MISIGHYLFKSPQQLNRTLLFHNIKSTLSRQHLLNTNNIRCINHKARAEATRSRLNPDNKSSFAEKFGYYTASVAVAMFAASFAAVPLYRIYCQATGKGGQAVKEENENKIVQMKKDESRLLTVTFDANTHSSMDWNFKPLQDKVKLHPGETALAFYRATNPLDELVIGVATYTVLPYEAGVYFNKIQCFCFEEQMLKPHEDVFMPVLFYVDPEYSKDPALATVDELVLSYTFFRSKDGEILDLDEPIELKKH